MTVNHQSVHTTKGKNGMNWAWMEGGGEGGGGWGGGGVGVGRKVAVKTKKIEKFGLFL